MANIRWVPPKKYTPKTTPAYWQSGAYGTPRPRTQRGHWVDARGRWLGYDKNTRPGTKKPTPTYGNLAADHPFLTPPGDTGYKGLSWEEIDRRANALADSQIAAKQAAIERQRAAAMQQAQRDAATYQALGGALMPMINQIAPNVQAIRNAAGQAMAQCGNQVSGAQAQALQGEQAQNAAFAAAQSGNAPAPAATGPGPAATGPGPAGPIGVDATAAMAASAQMGGVLP